MIINNDCLVELKKMNPGSVDMVYLDPPFFSQKVQSLTDKNGKIYSYDDKWCSVESYKEFIKARLEQVHIVLKNSGSVFLHCNNSASHYLRLILDDIFGTDNFRSEIIWSYKRWSSNYNGLLNAHQKILYYTKSSNYKFNKIFTEYSPTTNVDQNYQTRVRSNNGKAVYKIDKNGEQVIAGEKKGVPLSDVWGIPYLNPKAKERTGYPTQKPILLMEKIIEISTDIGDTVLDPFCGSGSTLVAAHMMNRKYIGIDNNSDAVEITKNRLLNPLKSESFLIKYGKDIYETKNEYEKSILGNFDCDIVQRNKGIDAILRKHYSGGPVAIRIQKQNEDLNKALWLLEQASKKKKCSYSIFIKTQPFVNKLQKEIPENILIIDNYESSFISFLNTANENKERDKN